MQCSVLCFYMVPVGSYTLFMSGYSSIYKNETWDEPRKRDTL